MCGSQPTVKSVSATSQNNEDVRPYPDLLRNSWQYRFHDVHEGDVMFWTGGSNIIVFRLCPGSFNATLTTTGSWQTCTSSTALWSFLYSRNVTVVTCSGAWVTTVLKNWKLEISLDFLACDSCGCLIHWCYFVLILFVLSDVSYV